MGIWRTLLARRILHASDAISVHGNVSQANLEPGPCGLELGALPTRQSRPQASLRTNIECSWLFQVSLDQENGLGQLCEVLFAQSNCFSSDTVTSNSRFVPVLEIIQNSTYKYTQGH